MCVFVFVYYTSNYFFNYLSKKIISIYTYNLADKNMRKKDVSKYLSLIRVITSIGGDRNQFCSLIQCLDEKSIKFLCECVKNGISKKQVLNLPPNERRQFLRLITPYKSLLKKICRKSKFYNMNKKRLIQKGAGFFIPLLSALIPLMTSLIPK